MDDEDVKWWVALVVALVGGRLAGPWGHVYSGCLQWAVQWVSTVGQYLQPTTGWLGQTLVGLWCCVRDSACVYPY